MRAGLPPAPTLPSLGNVESRTFVVLAEPPGLNTIYFRVPYRGEMVAAIFEQAQRVVLRDRRPYWEMSPNLYIPLRRREGKYYLLNHERP